MSDSADNLRIYEAVRQPPQESLRDFKREGGFSGTDINGMWRIKALTEQFGPCGLGWYTEVVERWTEQFDAMTVKAFARINLYIRDPRTGEWSKPIEGFGGNDFISKVKEKEWDNQSHSMQYTGKVVPKVNDECYKMAETDALGAACKKLGFGANVYWANDKSKYSDSHPQENAGSADQKKTEEPKVPKGPAVPEKPVRGRLF